jgi:hypothetical protein
MTSPGPKPAEQSAAPPAERADPVDLTSTDVATTVATTEVPEDEPKPTLLEQMGGVGGLIYSSVPVLVFVAVFVPSHSLAASIWASVGSAVAILIWRIVRKEPVQPAISGLFGVVIAAFIAYKTGSARGYFLFGIWTSLMYAGAFLLSIVVRWPLAGVVWSTLNGTGTGWRVDRIGRRYYDVATVAWVLVFGLRFVVQNWLYTTNQVGWLAFARIAQGWPLTIVGALITVWAVRKADLRQKALTEPAEEAETAAAQGEPA